MLTDPLDPEHIRTSAVKAYKGRKTVNSQRLSLSTWSGREKDEVTFLLLKSKKNGRMLQLQEIKPQITIIQEIMQSHIYLK